MSRLALVRLVPGPGALLPVAVVLVALVLGVAVVGVPPARPAAAATSTSLSQVASELRRDGVYVDPAAELAGAVDESRVEDAVSQADTPTYVAVLPSSAGTPDRIPAALRDAVQARGTYVALTGRSLRAGSTETRDGVAGALARQAVESNPGDVTSAVVGLVADLDEAAGGTASSGAASSRTGSSGADSSETGSSGTAPSSGGGGLLPLLLLLGVLGGGAALVATRSGRKVAKRAEAARRQELEDVRRTAEEDVTALGEDLASIDRTDVDLSDPRIDPRIRDQQLATVRSYETARDALARAQTVQDLAEVSRALEDGRYAMTATRALLRGEAPPPRRPPCFFDPRHGPSVADATWAPPGGETRSVPVCAADAQRLARGEEAETRMVWSQGRQVPMWGAPAAYGPFAGGYFGMGTGLFGGLLLGSVLTGGLGGGYGSGYAEGYGDAMEDGDDRGDGGDFGGSYGGDGGDYGGDFRGGGGDFGGGDFGGGDFGGGDFGGGGGDFH